MIILEPIGKTYRLSVNGLGFDMRFGQGIISWAGVDPRREVDGFIENDGFNPPSHVLEEAQGQWLAVLPGQIFRIRYHGHPYIFAITKV